MGNIVDAAARPARRPGRLTRAVAAGACAAGLALGASGCGFEVQTLQPYTPAEGINVDIGTNQANEEPAVKVRGLLVVSSQEGSGFLSGALVATEADTLTAVSGTALGVDGEPAGALTVTLPEQFAVEPGAGSLVLTDQTITTVEGDGLEAGLTAELTLSFAQAGEATVIVRVVDGTSPDYRTVSPSPVAASPGATPPAG